MNNEQSLTELQWKREVDGINSAFEDLMKKEQADFTMGNASNSMWGKGVKHDLLVETIKYLEWELDLAKDARRKYSADTFSRESEATLALTRCLGVNIVCGKKLPDGSYEDYVSKQRRNYFDLDKAAFLAVQFTLDNTMAPMVSVDEQNPVTGQWRKSPRRKTETELAEHIGSKLQNEIWFTMLSKNLPGYFRWANRHADGRDDKSMMPSSTAYWEKKLTDVLKHKRAQIHDDETLSPEMRAALIDTLTWKPWTRKQRVHIGQWLLRGVMKVAIKQKVLRYVDINYELRKGRFICLTEESKDHQIQIYNDAHAYCYVEKPMVCEPVPNTRKRLRGYLSPTAWVRPPGKDGTLKVSQKHLDFINKLQTTPYRINPFVLQLMNILADNDLELGKFKRYTFRTPDSVATRLGLSSITDYDEQTRLVVNHPDFKKMKAERSKDIGRERKKIILDASATRELHKLCKEMSDFEKLWLPTYWDFRGRVYYRTDLSPQAADPWKAVLQFANPTQVDDYTASFLKLSISAAAGKDKLSETERETWVDAHENDIANVALMLSDGDFSRAISFIEGELKSDPWEGLAACEEYYWCCLAPKSQRRTTTNFRCSLDATASGAQLTAGFRRSRSSAYKVNVLKRENGPSDVYQEVWSVLIDLVSHDGAGLRNLKWYSTEGHARKLAKLCYMSGQYGSGIKVQQRDFLVYHDKLPKAKQFNGQQLEFIWNRLPDAIDKVSSIRSFVKWMRRRVDAALENDAITFYTPSPVGNVAMSRYPKRITKQIQTFHYGSTKVDGHKFNHLEATREPDVTNWMKACAANAIHVQDASLLGLAYHDWELNLSCVHDCVCSAPGVSMMMLRNRFKKAYVETIKWDFWKSIYTANQLTPDEDMYSVVSVMDTFEPEEALEANYMIC